MATALLASPLGWIYYIWWVVPGVRPYVLAISSASLLYIAMSDLIPDLHRGEIDANSLRQVVLIAAGIFTVVVFERMIG